MDQPLIRFNPARWLLSGVLLCLFCDPVDEAFGQAWNRPRSGQSGSKKTRKDKAPDAKKNGGREGGAATDKNEPSMPIENL